MLNRGKLILLRLLFASAAQAQSFNPAVNQGLPASGANAWPIIQYIGGAPNAINNPVFTQSTNSLFATGSAAGNTVGDTLLSVYENGSGTITTGRPSISTSSTLIAAAATGGTSLGINIQNCTTADLYVGNTGVTTATGYKIPASPYPGQCNSQSFPFNGAIYGVFSSGTQTVGYMRYN